MPSRSFCFSGARPDVGATALSCFGTMPRVRSRDVPAAAGALARVLGSIATKSGSGAALVPVWKTLVGELVAAHAVPVEVHAGIVVIRCDAKAWRDELLPRAPELLERLKEATRLPGLRRLDFEVP
jgi:predicted nucleic acid-binding Zn ribbon protein